MLGAALLLAGDDSYSITNSIRLNGSSQYLTRTPGSAGNRKTWTFSCWMKKDTYTSADLILLTAWTTVSDAGEFQIAFEGSTQYVNIATGSSTYRRSNVLFRDPSAHGHLLVAFDSTQATASNRLKVYWNGSEITSWAISNDPALNQDVAVNNNVVHTIGRFERIAARYWGGYLSDTYLIDGQALTPSSFGKTDSNGVWVPIKYAGTYGTNGCKLAFGSSGALGTDTSGNGNNWTVNGSPVQTTDTPTNNYAVYNALVPASGSCTYSEGNTRVSNASAVGNSIPLTVGGTAKHYVEFKLNTCGNDTHYVGAADINWPYWGGADKQLGYYANNSVGIRTRGAGSSPQIYRNSTTAVNTTTAINSGDYFCVAWDNATGNVWLGSIISGTRRWYDSAGTERTTDEPGLGTNVTYTLSGFSAITAGITPRTFSGVTGDITALVQDSSLQKALPSGFKSLCTANLTSTAVTTSGTFTGNANADGPFIWTNGNPATLTINGNAVTFGTHADKTAGGFKLRSSSASYNTSGSNTWTATAGKRFVYSATSINTAQGNP